MTILAILAPAIVPKLDRCPLPNLSHLRCIRRTSALLIPWWNKHHTRLTIVLTRYRHQIRPPTNVAQVSLTVKEILNLVRSPRIPWSDGLAYVPPRVNTFIPSRTQSTEVNYDFGGYHPLHGKPHRPNVLRRPGPPNPVHVITKIAPAFASSTHCDLQLSSLHLQSMHSNQKSNTHHYLTHDKIQSGSKFPAFVSSVKSTC